MTGSRKRDKGFDIETRIGLILWKRIPCSVGKSMLNYACSSKMYN